MLRQDTTQKRFTEVSQVIPNVENILEDISDAFALIDKTWRFTYVNQAAVQLIAKSRDEILGQISWDILSEAMEFHLLYTELHRAMEKGIPVHFEIPYSPADLWYECDAYPSPEGLSIFFRNITKRKQLERQLQERLEEIEKLIEILPLGIVFAHDSQCRFITGNHTACKLLRLPYQASWPKTISLDKFSSPIKIRQNDHEISPQELLLRHTVAPGVEAKESELTLVYNHGEETTVYSYASPLFNENGQARGCVAAFMDITEYSQAQGALSRSQQRLSAVIRASNASYYEFATDLSWGIIDKHFAESLGYSWERIPPVSELWNWWESRLHPEDHTQVLQAYHSFIQGLLPFFHQEYRMQHKDGSWRWWRVVNTTVEHNSQGHAIIIAGLIFDITEQQQTEKALRESEERFRTMAETIPNIIFTSGPDGSRDYTNSRFYEYTHLAPELAKGFGWMDILHPDDVEQTKAHWTRSIESGEPVEVQHRLRTAGGDYRWFQNRARPIRDEMGRITKWFGTCSDIHDLVCAQESLRKISCAKDEFLAMLSHELRSPLVPICNAVELMRLHPDKLAIQSKGVDIIDRQAKHLTCLVNGLLNATRIITGKIIINIELVDLKEVLLRAIETIQPIVSHELTFLFPSQQLKVQGDPARLIQIFASLLDNAIKYTPSGGHICLQVEQQQNNVIIRVRDDGLGIPPEKLSSIFDLFVQINPSLDRSQGGLGLGLALVRRLTEIHGGKVTAFSEGQGKGSEFTINLPLMLRTTSQTIGIDTLS
ncbi:MAG: PAS domain-containing sensor histidine kinase [Candidatus Nitrosoglobus sp.]